MNAARRWGSVNVWNISSAVVRNSSVAVTVVVLTEDLPVVVVVVVLEGRGVRSLSGCHVGVAKPLEGLEPGVCCRSFPCSLIKAGPRLEKTFRSSGVSFDLTRSLTGCFSFVSE